MIKKRLKGPAAGFQDALFQEKERGKRYFVINQ